MATSPLKPLFVSHGAPTLVLETDNPAHIFLKQLGKDIERQNPKAIVIFSAHWESRVIEVTKSTKQIYDFYGFPSKMYKLQYNPPESEEVAKKVVQLLKDAGIPCKYSPERGVDHGTWVPLMTMLPAAKIPVVQVSLQQDLDPLFHIKLGQTLKPLINDGVLLIGSGSSTHNIRLAFDNEGNTTGALIQFEEWLKSIMELSGTQRNQQLLEWKKQPSAKMAHPREEHLIPLFVVAGAGGIGERVHMCYPMPNLGQAFYSFEITG